MPSLDFKGKSFIYTHHLGVPYRELLVIPDKSMPASGRPADLDDSLILHGDNLEALKALLPRYAGKIDCICIDPPYNTGSEGWCYNDAVNSPLMREWLKKASNPVEREDLQRHDKWLCMMWPRLQLLHELLDEFGTLWMTLDDNEIGHARVLLDEVFGEDCFVGGLVWQKRTSRENRATLAPAHDYILLYSKCEARLWKAHRNLLGPSETGYANPDGDVRGEWTSIPFSAQGFRKDQMYKITTPTGVVLDPPRGRCWGARREVFERLLAEKRIYFPDKGNGRPRVKQFKEDAKGLVPMTLWFSDDVGDTEESKKQILEIFQEGTPFDTPKPTRLIRRMLQIATKPDSIILDSFAGSGTTAHAVLELNKEDRGNRRFILVQCDEFNKDTGEMTDLCNTLTAERVRRVISGYDYTGTVETELRPSEMVTWTTFAKNKKRSEILQQIEDIENFESGNYDKIEKRIKDGVLSVVGVKQVKGQRPGLGGSFSYVELGDSMDLDRLLAETPGTLPAFASLARYLFFTSTGHTLATTEPSRISRSSGRAKAKHKSIEAPASGDGPILIGETPGWRVYLHYQADEAWLRSPAAAFTRSHAEVIANESQASGKQVLVFAASKFIAHRALRELRVDFAQLPYALYRIQAE